MSLLKLLLGKKKTFNDPVFGIIESERMRGENRNKLYSWYSSYLMPNAPEKSIVIMDGNYIKPNPIQLVEIKAILKNLDLLWEKIDEKLKSESNSLTLSEREAFRNWKSTFYLGALHPIGKNAEPNFEICFEPFDSNSNGYMIFSYAKGELTEMEVGAPK